MNREEVREIVGTELLDPSNFDEKNNFKMSKVIDNITDRIMSLAGNELKSKEQLFKDFEGGFSV